MSKLRRSRIHVSAGDRTLEIVCIIIFTIAAILCMYPFYYVIINSISANDISARGDVIFWPKGLHFHNFTSAFKIEGLPRAFLISILRTVIGTSFTVMASAYLGYMFTLEKMWNDYKAIYQMLCKNGEK